MCGSVWICVGLLIYIRCLLSLTLFLAPLNPKVEILLVRLNAEVTGIDIPQDLPPYYITLLSSIERAHARWSKINITGSNAA